MLETLLSPMTPWHFLMALSIALLAGLVKGLVGFALPMIMISGLGSFLSSDLALAGLILATVVTNGMQAFEQGLRQAWQSITRFRVFLLCGLICLLLSAQAVRWLSAEAFYLAIGVPVSGFALWQLMGKQLSLANPNRWIEAGGGAFAGAVGGVSGILGPPTVSYLTAINTEKNEQMRVQGVIFGLGATALFAAHTASGVIRSETLPFSAALVFPAALGMWLGTRLRVGVDQVLFRRLTLIVLLVAGVNLVRRGLV